MRLRSNCTSYKSSMRRRLRLALAVALTAAPGMALAVEKLPHSLPAPLNHSELNHPEYCEAGLLPYPFGPTSKCAGGKPEEKLERLVALVGLQRGILHPVNAGQQRSAANYEVAQATLNQVSLPAMYLHAVPSQVVSASGTQSIGPDSGESTVPSLPTLDLPALDLPTLAQSQALPAARGTAAATHAVMDSDDLSQSLIDIAIPLDMIPPAQPSPVAEATVMSFEPPSQESPLLESQAVAKVSASPSVGKAASDRKPELIQPAKSLSLTTRQPSNQSVNLSLNDTPASASASASAAGSLAYSAGNPAQMYALSDATLEDIQPGDRGVALHLSSASQHPMKAAEMATSESKQPQFPQRGSAMQVRIEGEPAPLLTGRLADDMSPLAPAAPMPSMGRPSHSATPARASLDESNNKVKAAFATRTSIVPDRDLERSMSTLGGVAKQVREPLTLGLQESQTLSAQFVITELSVEHPSICQLMQTGESSVSLVGVRPGATRIALVMVDDTGERQVEIHEVSVTSGPAAAQSLPDMAAEISRAVGRLVPNCDVEIVAYEDYLLVHGFTHYESDAKKILSLVRKTSLVPVVDQLKSNDQ